MNYAARCVVLTMLCLGGTSPALADTTGLSALSQLQPSLSLRARYETVDQSGLAKNGNAATLRHRIGVKTGLWKGLSLFAETESVLALADERYNNAGGGNGLVQYPIIADPTDTELNQAWINYSPSKSLQLRLGRQRLIYGNARFLGNVGWRQNEQTYDALALSYQSGALAVNYSHLSRVNDIFFNNTELNGHALQADFKSSALLSASAYAYLLDFDASTADSQTLGLRLAGGLPMSESVKLQYSVEFARQQDYADAASFEADYLLTELGAKRGPYALSLSRELLGGDGNSAFSTPLATKHKFNGWADIFLATPAAGLVDSYLTASYAGKAWIMKIIYHQFEADQGDVDYGDELDMLLVWKCAKAQALKLKYADYRADAFKTDTRKLTLEWNYSL